MENKRSGRNAAADTPLVTIPRSGDWTTRSQGKLAQFHVISEDNQTEDDGRRQLGGPGARKILSEDTNWRWWGMRGRGVKKINEKMTENSTARTMPARFILASAQHPVVTRPKSARSHWLPRVPARRQSDSTSDYGSDYLAPDPEQQNDPRDVTQLNKGA